MAFVSSNPKVAIPRMNKRPPEEEEALQHEKYRVKKACTHCRMRKVKCSGELPRCKGCEEANVECAYSQNRKDRLKEYAVNIT